MRSRPGPLTPSAILRLSLCVLLPLALAASRSFAGVAPTTPTFQLAWGSAGSAPGQFSLPFGVATDALGNVYVLERGGQRVQKFDALGNFITQWGSPGSGAGQFNAPSFIAVDASGNVYVTDSGNNRVQKFTSGGAFVTQWGTPGSGPGQFNNPYAIAVDDSGDVYVTEWNGCRVQVFTNSGAYVTGWGGYGSGPGQFTYASGIAVDPKGKVFVADQGDRVQEFTGTGTYLGQWGSPGGGNGQFDSPNGMATDAVGNVYVAEYTNNRVQKFANDGTYLAQWGTAGTGDGQFTNPVGVAVDPAGDVLVTDFNGNRMEGFSGAGVAVAQAPVVSVGGWSAFTGAWPGFSIPEGVATDGAGNYYVADYGSNHIVKIIGGSDICFGLKPWGSVGFGDGQFDGPYGVAKDAAGNVYVTDRGNDRVEKFTSDGIYLAQWGSPGSGNGQFDGPTGVATDAAGDVYIADALNFRIQKFTSGGTYLAQWGSPGSGDGQFNGPTGSPKGLATDAVGNVYAADTYNHRVQKFTDTGVYLAQWGSFGSGNGQFKYPMGVATDAAGNVYVADEGNSRIQKFTSNGAYLAQWDSSVYGPFAHPDGVATDALGNVYVADTGNNFIQRFAAPATIALVSDVDHDQGGQVHLRVLRSSFDDPSVVIRNFGDPSWPCDTITAPVLRYDVYRRIEPLSSARPVGDARAHSVAPSAVQLDGWDAVGSFDANGSAVYDVVVPTLENATATSLYYTAFMVRAVPKPPLDQYIVFDSAPGYGYSVDNLAPPAPTVFLAAYQAGATHLHWSVNSASDFATFKLYRGASAGFTPGSGNLVSATTDTGYVDPGAAGSWYKLSAVDLNGNESAYAVVGPSQTTGVDPTAPPTLVFALAGVSPNPVTSRTLAVRFTLPVASRARLELVDVAGRVVAKREVGALGAGMHTLDLAQDARIRPGLYFVRLTQGANSSTKRVTVIE